MKVYFTIPGGGTPDEALCADIPERETAYPEHTIFGILPAYDPWVPHAKGITPCNVTFELAASDAPPP